MAELFNEIIEDIKQQRVPRVSRAWAAICLLLNCFLPGVGTIVSSIIDKKWSALVIGIVQLLTAWFILGWLWSLYWGYLIAYYAP
mmetsp:Transcript_18401/g.45185  ORF Transcript_18401/g.45185 Transcript_18401/m.45185 type:complete len:85 (-) Transcript_18401:204-458(-)